MKTFKPVRCIVNPCFPESFIISPTDEEVVFSTSIIFSSSTLYDEYLEFIHLWSEWNILRTNPIVRIQDLITEQMIYLQNVSNYDTISKLKWRNIWIPN